MDEVSSEAKAVVERYARRTPGDLYNVLRPEVWMSLQERQRAILRLLRSHSSVPLAQIRLLEIGCGSGNNLLELARLGFDPANLVGNELLHERAIQARRNLSALTEVHEGDAILLPFRSGSFDIVYVSLVFTSLLDHTFQELLARRMWDWLRPKGAVLWYDFVYDNPSNPDVRGVPLRRIRELFPKGSLSWKRITLAPPLARRVAAIHPSLYTLFNSMPLLRSHVICWIEKS